MKSLKTYFTKKTSAPVSLLQPAVAAYNKMAAVAFVLTVTPYVALAQSDNAWKIGGSESGLSDLNAKSESAGTIVVNVFRLIVLCLLLWKIIVFIKDKKFMDLVYCGIAAACLGWAPKIVNAFYKFGSS